MVEAQKNTQVDIKISLDLSAQGKSPIVKRVLASNFTTLTAQAKKLCKQHGVPDSDCQLRYYDGDSWVICEDDDDLQLAVAIAMSDKGKLTFTIKPSVQAPVPAPISAPVSSMASAACGNDDDSMQDESTLAGPKKGNKKNAAGKGIPRKALKNLINNELEKQAKEVFQSLMTSQDPDLPQPDQTPEESEAVHTGVACDGCGVNPIRGLRYKCSVRKNYDLCATCEERGNHEHAFLKIRRPGGAPDVMITMLNEDQPGVADNEA